MRTATAGPIAGRGPLRLRHVAPAGAPVRLGDLARATALLLGGGDPSVRLRREFKERYAVRHCFVTSTGRAGMTMLLRALSRLAPRRSEVIVPSYTCYSVAASVVKAGLRPRIVDISPETLDYDLEELRAADWRGVLAVIATNLYGIPNDMPALQEIARAHGAFLVDDAAQSMGGVVGGRPSGTWGDAGLFSLDKGKNVSAIDGGVVVAHDDRIAEAVAREWDSLAPPAARDALDGAVKAMVYAVMLRPWLYWIPERIPQLGLGRTSFRTDFPLQRPSGLLVSLGAVMMRRLEEFTQTRVANATALLDGLRTVPHVRMIAPHPGASPVYLRLPILAVRENLRPEMVQALRGAGIGATTSYPASLADVAELQPFLGRAVRRASGGREVARRIITIPTHPFVTRTDVERAIEIVTHLSDRTPAAAVAGRVVRTVS